MPTIFRALIFDFNGLIIDDEPIHCTCFQKILGTEGITLTDTDYWEKYLGFDDRDLIEAVFKRDEKKITPKKLKDLVAKKSALYLQEVRKGPKFFPGINEFVSTVSQKYLLAIVSGALRKEIDFVLKAGKMSGAFAEIVGAENVHHGKPEPEGFMVAYARLKKRDNEIRPENCLVLEDSHAGIEAAHRAGMKVAALTHTYDKDSLREADYVFDTFGEIEEFLISS